MVLVRGSLTDFKIQGLMGFTSSNFIMILSNGGHQSDQCRLGMLGRGVWGFGLILGGSHTRTSQESLLARFLLENYPLSICMREPLHV